MARKIFVRSEVELITFTPPLNGRGKLIKPAEGIENELVIHFLNSKTSEFLIRMVRLVV